MIINICDICTKTVEKEEPFHPQCIAGDGIYDMCDTCYNRISETIKQAAQHEIDSIILENQDVLISAASVVEEEHGDAE